MTDRMPNQSIFHLTQSGGSDSGRFSIDSSDPPAWSHITIQKTKTKGMTLALHSGEASSKPAAVARERQVSDRPGVAESAQAISGVFEIVDQDGEPLATLRKNALRSVLRTTWEVELVSGSRVTGRETNPLKIAIRRMFMLANLLIDIPIRPRSGFVFRGTPGVLFTIETGAERTTKVAVIAPADARIALLQAVLTRTR